MTSCATTILKKYFIAYQRDGGAQEAQKVDILQNIFCAACGLDKILIYCNQHKWANMATERYKNAMGAERDEDAESAGL